jgi:hypothetical protein
MTLQKQMRRRQAIKRAAHSRFLHCRTQSANAGPELLLHETLSASPSFETDTLPPVQVIDASVSPEPQASVQLLLLQASCLTT